MYRLPFAMRSFACSLEVADMYPACLSAFFAVALLGLRTRLCLISDQIYYDHKGSQTLGAYFFPFHAFGFCELLCGFGCLDRSRYLIFLIIKISS